MQRGSNRLGFQRRSDAGRHNYRTLELALDFLREPADRGLWAGRVTESASAHAEHRAPTIRSAWRGLARREFRAADAGAFVRAGMGLELVGLCPLLRCEFGCITDGAGRRAPGD